MNTPRSRAPGLTLIEVLVALALVTILLALAMPAYDRYLQRSHRTEAVRVMLAIAACEERVRARSGYYDTTQCLENTATAHYAFALSPAAQSEALLYVVSATPVNTRGGETCGTLTLDQAGTRTASGAAGWADCWSGR